MRIFSGLPSSLARKRRLLRRWDFVALAFVLLLLSATIDSCRRPKEIEKNKQNQTQTVDTSQADTSKGFISEQYDSLSHKFTNFFHSLLPQKQDTTKGIGIVSSPPPENNSPVVSNEPTSIPGFLAPPIKRTIDFDSSGNIIEHDEFLGSDVRTPMPETFDQYVERQQNQTLQSGFEAALHKQIDTGKTVDQQTGILGDYNSISIPIPPSIVPTIFGKPSINLKINGDVGIHLAYRDQVTYATAGANFFGSEQGLDFKQELNINTTGTIGDKLKIGADWGSDRMFQYDNLLKFTYQGYPDEILQEFDAGNVTFTTPSQYIAPQQDLFGLKAITRFGPLYLTMVAAQKKGSRQSKSFGGGAGVATEHMIQPWNYRKNRFFLDTSFIKYYEQKLSTIPEDQTPLIQSGTVEVWTSSNQQTNLENRSGIAWYSLPSSNGAYSGTYRISHSQGDSVVYGRWIKMDSTRYKVDYSTGVLILSQEPEDVYTSLAVSYQTADGRRYGDLSSNQVDSPIVLKLIKPANTYNSPTLPWWNNILKSTYYIGGVGFDPSNFSTRIFYIAPGGHEIEYPSYAHGSTPLKAISVFGLDRYNNSQPSNKSPDGLIDFSTQFPSGNYIVDPTTGTLVFPYLQPFGRIDSLYNAAQKQKQPTYTKDSNFYMPEIYTTPQTTLTQRETKLTMIDVKFSGGVSSTMNLGAFNLVQGSVRVTIGGTQLVEGTDYRVDYNSGTVTILNPDLINTGQVNIEYDVNDIFTNATKNVLGVRAEVPLFDETLKPKGVIGLTAMNYSASLPTLKTRPGEEPISNWILGTDGSYDFNTPFVTDALNFLPMFNLKEKSDLAVKLDGAVSLPNPNTDVSPMPVDNGASIAYLDDFEGGLNEFPLYLNYGRWVPTSQPVDSAFQARHPVGTNPDSEYWSNPINMYKGFTAWNAPASLPPITDIKPNEPQATAGQTATTMIYYFDPTKPGIYNPTSSYPTTRDNWGGMLQYAPGLNVAATNTDAIQFYIKLDQPLNSDDEDTAELRFDLGVINDDIIPDKKLETEDVGQNGRYEPGADVGLDGLTTAQEQEKWANAINKNDPSNDDYSATNPFPSEPGINGQEGNADDAFSGLTPDHEDLDASGSVNLNDAYYEYEVPLNMLRNKYIIGGNPSKGWYQLRIPLADFSRIVGTNDSSFSNISYYRIWTKDVLHPIELELFEFMLVGSEWTRGTLGLNPTNPIGDTSLKVDYVNIWDNSGTPDFYYTPPGAATTLIPSSTTYIPGNEQSLLMHTACIPNGSQREAQRIFPNPNDLFNYRAMAIWVHGDTTSSSEISNAPLSSSKDTANRVWVYWKVGTDAFDYYEYREPLLRGWQNLHMDFNTFTNLKVSRAASANADTIQDPLGIPGAQYIVVGSPTFTNAPYFVLGIDNESGQSCLTTDVWWDELRLLDANNQPGFAWNATTALKLAEFGKISATIANQDASFHQVDEQFNTTRSTQFNWNVTGQFAMEKMLPKWMQDKGSKLPLTVAHTESIITPEYIVNTDVDLASAISSIQSNSSLTGAQRQMLIDSLTTNNQTLQVKNSFGMNDIALRFPGSFFLLPLLVNRLDFGFGYTETYTRSPEYQYDYAFGWTVTGRYAMPNIPPLGLEPIKWWGTTTPFIGNYSQWKVNLVPSNVSFALSATRGREHSLAQLSTLSLPPDGADSADIAEVLASRVPLVNRVFTVTRGMQATWKPFEGGMLSPSFDYALDVSSNLSPLETSTQFNTPTSHDANGNPIYNYDSVYYYQRNFSDILHDIFFHNGALADLGEDYNASQRVHMSTTPRLPLLFGLEKLIKPVFDYSVTYKWLNTETGLQNAKQG
ncbi:MAG TPA: cell surface protein SprA, partial [Candidatus Kapabacteria bacterium]